MNNPPMNMTFIVAALAALVAALIGFMIGWSEGRRAYAIEQNEWEEQRKK